MEPLDDLDRALFALPLEEPPPSLRATILAATVAARSSVLRPWEIVGVGVAFAVLAWLGIAVVSSGGGALVTSWVGVLERAMNDATLLYWLAAGAATALWLSFLTLAPANAKLTVQR